MSTPESLDIPALMAIDLQLYTRAGCHLCDEMKAVILSLAEEYPLNLQEIDIAADGALEADFGTEIPVLFVNGRKAFKYRVSAPELRRRLARETRSSPRWWPF